MGSQLWLAFSGLYITEDPGADLLHLRQGDRSMEDYVLELDFLAKWTSVILP